MTSESRAGQPALQDAEIAQYRALSAPAVAGLILGLAAPLAMVVPMLWGVPLAGIACSTVALWRIARNAPALAGRKAALAGLTLSVLFAVAAPTHWSVYRGLVRREAQRFARCWFEFLADNQPHKAHQLTHSPEFRRPLDDKLLDHYAENSSTEELDLYVARPPVRTLLELGRKARVRYCTTSYQAHEGRRDILYQVYAVTSGDGGRDETFFVGLELKREILDTGRANWYLVDAYPEQPPD